MAFVVLWDKKRLQSGSARLSSRELSSFGSSSVRTKCFLVARQHRLTQPRQPACLRRPL